MLATVQSAFYLIKQVDTMLLTAVCFSLRRLLKSMHCYAVSFWEVQIKRGLKIWSGHYIRLFSIHDNDISSYL